MNELSLSIGLPNWVEHGPLWGTSYQRPLRFELNNIRVLSHSIPILSFFHYPYKTQFKRLFRSYSVQSKMNRKRQLCTANFN